MGRRAKQEYVNNKDFLAAMIEYKASVQTAETKNKSRPIVPTYVCLLYTSDAADDSLRVDLGGRRII